MEPEEIMWSISIGLMTGIISGIIVSLCFKLFEITSNTRQYIIDIQQYMYEVSNTLIFDVDNPDLFWKKIYNRPRNPGIIFKLQKYKPEIKIFFENQLPIELAYRNYLLCTEERNINNQYFKKLENLLFEYQDSANRISKLIYK